MILKFRAISLFYLFIHRCPNPPLHLKSEFTHQPCNTPGKMRGKNPIELNYYTIQKIMRRMKLRGRA